MFTRVHLIVEGLSSRRSVSGWWRHCRAREGCAGLPPSAHHLEKCCAPNLLTPRGSAGSGVRPRCACPKGSERLRQASTRQQYRRGGSVLRARSRRFDRPPALAGDAPAPALSPRHPRPPSRAPRRLASSEFAANSKEGFWFVKQATVTPQ